LKSDSQTKLTLAEEQKNRAISEVTAAKSSVEQLQKDLENVNAENVRNKQAASIVSVCWRQTEIQRDRRTDRQTDRQTDRERERGKGRDRDRDRDRKISVRLIV
jgi:hypothetical protein